MKTCLVSILAFLACNSALADDSADAAARIHEYFDLFNAREVQKIASAIYATPLHIGGGDSHRVWLSAQVAVDNLENLYKVITERGRSA